MHASFTKVFQVGQPTRVSSGGRVSVAPKAQSDYKGGEQKSHSLVQSLKFGLQITGSGQGKK